MRKRSMVLAGVATGAMASLAGAQTALYSNAGAAPNLPALGALAQSGSGVAAPGGFQWSETPTDGTRANALAGFSAHAIGTTGAYRFADDFVVPAGNGWRLSRVTLYAYPRGADPTTPFVSANARIWQGRPGDATSFVISGDAVTNRLISVTPTNVYRIFNSTIGPFPTVPEASRLVQRLDVDLGQVYLAPGRYWIDWQVSTGGVGEAYFPAATIGGTRGQAGWNGRQYRPAGISTQAGWFDAVDPGKPAGQTVAPQDLPFILFGGPGCAADMDDGTGTGTPDGGVTIDDLLYFLDRYALGAPNADLDDGTGTGTRDGGVTIDDLLYFVARYEAGC